MSTELFILALGLQERLDPFLQRRGGSVLRVLSGERRALRPPRPQEVSRGAGGLPSAASGTSTMGPPGRERASCARGFVL